LAWRDWDRFAELLVTTLLLMAGTLIVTVPSGTLAAFLLYRTDLPFRRFFRFILLLTLFIPLPLFTTAWQAALGSGGWLPLGVWNQSSFWKPWPTGLGPAIWVHAMAAFPWVILIMGQGFLWVERELEEDALTIVGPFRVFLHVTLHRSWGALGAAALWVVMPIATEITVTDVMQVRTFAEEIYTQLVLGEHLGLHRALAVSCVPLIIMGTILFMVIRGLERRIPSLESYSMVPFLFRLRGLRWPLFFLTLTAMTVMASIPVASLVWKAGLEGGPPVWTGATVTKTIGLVLERNTRLVINSVQVALTNGFMVALFSLVICWLALDSRRFLIGILGILTLAWVLPGPLVGFGLKETISHIVELNPEGLAARLLYYGPSPVPVWWANFIRFLPFGMALLWPMVRMIPREIRESAQLEGARPGRMLVSIFLPLAVAPYLRTILAVAVLSLGELGAGKIVQTPDYQIFAHVVFEQMHYGVHRDLAGLCLVLLGLVALGGGLMAIPHWFLKRSNEGKIIQSP
jgi:iron(III) transport system permease protein